MVRYTSELLDAASALLAGGSTITETATALGLDHGQRDHLSRLLRARGLKTRGLVYRPSSTAVDYPREEMRDRFLAGESVKALATAYGVDRATIRAQLVRFGIEPRGRSDAMVVRYQRMSPRQRAAQSRAAHEAMLGVAKPMSTMLARSAARSKEVGEGELVLAAEFRRLGISFEPQAPVHVYNIDLLVGDIAVEPRCRNDNPMEHPKRRGRTEALLRRGIATLWITYSSIEALRACLSYVVADVEDLRMMRAADRRPRVMRCVLSKSRKATYCRVA